MAGRGFPCARGLGRRRGRAVDPHEPEVGLAGPMLAHEDSAAYAHIISQHADAEAPEEQAVSDVGEVWDEQEAADDVTEEEVSWVLEEPEEEEEPCAEEGEEELPYAEAQTPTDAVDDWKNDE